MKGEPLVKFWSWTTPYVCLCSSGDRSRVQLHVFAGWEKDGSHPAPIYYFSSFEADGSQTWVMPGSTPIRVTDGEAK